MAEQKKFGYRDIKADILLRIKTRQWPPGMLIPNEAALAAEFNCARATVNRAMRELAEIGLIDRKRKAGSRVCAAPKRSAIIDIPLTRIEVELAGKTYRYALIDRAIIDTPAWLRARLDLTTGDKVVHLTCMHYANNLPYQFEERWINIHAIPHVAQVDFKTQGPNEWLVNEVPLSDAEFVFYASAASDSLAEFLSVGVGEPVFTAERITWQQGEFVTFARMNFAQGYRMITQSG